MRLDSLHAAVDQRLKGKPVVGKLWQWSQQHPRWAAAVVVVLLVVVAWLATSVTQGTATLRTYYTVKRGDFLISVVEGGTLRSLNEFSIRSEVETMTKIISIVPEGSSVRKGDLLVQLDSSQIKESMESQEITLEGSRFALVQAEQALAIQKSVVESNIKDAELKVEFAKSDLEKYMLGDWLQLKNDAESRITLADQDLERTRDRLNWTKVLNEKGYATKSELQADSLALKQKEVALAQAKEAQQLLIKYDYPKRRRLLEAYVESYEKELERLKQRSAGSIAQSEADLTARRRTLALQQERYDEMKKQMALCTIHAPSDGLVVYSSSGSGSYSSVLIEEGASIRYRQEIIKLPDINQMVIEIRVHESHITRIRPGQTSYVTIDSMPDSRLKGHVHKVAVLPDSSSRYYNPTLKVYVTEVLIDDPLPIELKPGVSGRAEIVITNLLNVVAVPIQAVTSVKGEQVCFGKEAKPMPVEVGLYNDKFIEIRTGLKEGDSVLLAPLLAESDEIDLSGSIVAAKDYEADRKSTPKKRKTGSKGVATQGKPVATKPPTPLETLQQPLNELRRAAQPLEPPLAALKQPAVRGAPGAPTGRSTNAVTSTGRTSVQSP
ncbi:MAG: efflux RND transporter periplasmic adaptor subunit [Verrucomicrobia bacterium]|nr:efflux RND transporter periplasmic adaptor subunit [Verrucomicrobiota bacterium]